MLFGQILIHIFLIHDCGYNCKTWKSDWGGGTFGANIALTLLVPVT